jgi:hypothetical protein
LTAHEEGGIRVMEMDGLLLVALSVDQDTSFRQNSVDIGDDDFQHGKKVVN